MPRPSRRKTQSRNARSNVTHFCIKNCVRYVLSVARCGMTEAQANEFCLSNCIIPPTKVQFYVCQGNLIPIIENIARECCADERKKMNGPYFISYDGSWSSRRNASHCIVEFISPEGKIVDFDYLSRARLNGENPDNYDGPSNRMEDILVERMAAKWKADTNLIGFVHDGDVKTAKFWHIDIGIFPDPVEFHDPGHMKKTVGRLFDKYNTEKRLYGLKKLVLGQFSYICKLQKCDINEKVQRWENLEARLLQIVTTIHPNKKPFADHLIQMWHDPLQGFINETVNLVWMCSYADTQKNESFHSLKAKLAPKHIKWNTSWKLRMCLAIIRWNLGENARSYLDEKLGIQYSPLCSEMLSKLDRILQKRRIKSNSNQYRHHRNQQRNKKRSTNKASKEGHQYAGDGKKTATIITSFRPAQMILPGIVNIGQTCYLASVLQLLANSPIIEMFYNLERTDQNPLLLKLNQIFRQLNDHKNILNDQILDLLIETPDFSPNQPSDPIEYLICILNNIQTIRNRCNYLNCQKLHCPICNYTNTFFDRNLFIDIWSNAINENEGINLKTEEEVEFMCEGCRQQRMMELTNTYCYLPRFIFIQPSYANQENISKIQTNFSRRLHFYKNENQIQKRYTYKLNGVIVYSQSQNDNR